MSLVSTVKRIVKREIRSIADGAVLTPTALKYVPAQEGRDPLLLPDTQEDNGLDERGLPIPPRPLWIAYGETPEQHLASGVEHVESMRHLLKETGYTISPGHRVLDFGCGAGRMVRHFASEAASAEFWGADVSAEHIAWANRHLRPPFRFVTTTTIPHLPFPDGYFNLVYAGSVFTHIADLADAWLLEVRRVLDREGRAFLTFHDSHTMRLLQTAHSRAPVAKRLASVSHGNFSLMAFDRWPEYGGTQVFYSDVYLKATLEAVFRVCSMTREAHGYQTAAIVMR